MIFIASVVLPEGTTVQNNPLNPPTDPVNQKFLGNPSLLKFKVSHFLFASSSTMDQNFQIKNRRCSLKRISDKANNLKGRLWHCP